MFHLRRVFERAHGERVFSYRRFLREEHAVGVVRVSVNTMRRVFFRLHVIDRRARGEYRTQFFYAGILYASSDE